VAVSGGGFLRRPSQICDRREVKPSGLASINHAPLIVIEVFDFKMAVRHSGGGEGVVVFAHGG
jgi:hypothetical protein